MKIITWNCNMAFRKKAALLLSQKPDILVVPECEHPDNLFMNGLRKPTDQLWFGKNRHKGLGIFSYSDFTFRLLDVYNDDLKLIAPIAVKGKHFAFTLFAVWANNPTDPDGQYVTQVWKALRHYDQQISSRQTMLIGDFNSNTIWDRPRREGNHSTVVQLLEAKGIYSVYHKYFKQTQGKERHPTLYMYRHKDKPYHIDYCFVSQDMIQYLKKVRVGTHERWNQYSDHVPVTIIFDPAMQEARKNSKPRNS